MAPIQHWRSGFACVGHEVLCGVGKPTGKTIRKCLEVVLSGRRPLSSVVPHPRMVVSFTRDDPRIKVSYQAENALVQFEDARRAGSMIKTKH